MKKIVQTALATSIALALTACGSDNKTSTPVTTATTVEIGGSAVKGSLKNAKVEIFRASDTERANALTTVPVDVQTDDNGDYAASVVNASGEAIVGPLVITITADDDTEMRCDAAVTCGDTPRGEWIPSAEVQGISLSTFTVAKADTPISADANSLTSMATDALLAAVAANTAVSIDDLSADDLLVHQKNASMIVGKLLGLGDDFKSTNIYDIKISDSTNKAAVVAGAAGTNGKITTLLSVVNASLAGKKVPTGSTLGAEIKKYVDNVAVVAKAISKAIAESKDGTVNIANVLTSSTEIQDAKAALETAQTDISDQVTAILDAIKVDSPETTFEDVKVPAVIPTIEIDKGDIVFPTGATGVTGGS